MRVLVALSGGVDSAVCAARMVEEGYQVTGVYMKLDKDPISVQRKDQALSVRGCGSPQDMEDAARVAELLGMDFEVWDLSEDFHDIVMNDFVQQYRKGLTPNPCVRCNQFVKFHELTKRAWARDFDAVATGHYAKIVNGSAGKELHRAAARNKDQSYVLAVTGFETIERVFFPLGDFESKADVRAEADRRGLPVSSKPDSFDICFIPDGDTRGFLSRALGERPGEVLDTDGKVVGQHGGFYNFTVGQRKGIGLPGPAKDGKPRYVLRTVPERNQVIVGCAELLSVCEIMAGPVVWMVRDSFDQASDVHVQFRAHGQAVPARVRVDNVKDPNNVNGFTQVLNVELKQTVRAVAAGQSLVVYRGDQVLAQANIISAKR